LRGNNEERGSEKQAGNYGNKTFEVINLEYLEELSGGDKVFEKSMVEQFLQQVPDELKAIQDAFTKSNYGEVAQIAHNMKTSISFMGLTEKLNPSLDYIENNARIESKNIYVQEKIMMVKEICLQVFREAKAYLERIN